MSIDPTNSNINPNSYSSYSIPNKHSYAGSSVNTYQRGRLTSNDASQITGSTLREGAIKGKFNIKKVKAGFNMCHMKRKSLNIRQELTPKRYLELEK